MKTQTRKRFMQILGLLTILLLAHFKIMANQSAEMPNTSTYSDGSLGTCPKKPNCVSSFSEKDDPHYIEPLLDISLANLAEIDSFFKNCKRISVQENYRYYTCETNLFKFIDDVEILYFPTKKTLHYRSASRVGHSDLNKNQTRIMELILFLKER